MLAGDKWKCDGGEDDDDRKNDDRKGECIKRKVPFSRGIMSQFD